MAAIPGPSPAATVTRVAAVVAIVAAVAALAVAVVAIAAVVADQTARIANPFVVSTNPRFDFPIEARIRVFLALLRLMPSPVSDASEKHPKAPQRFCEASLTGQQEPNRTTRTEAARAHQFSTNLCFVIEMRTSIGSVQRREKLKGVSPMSRRSLAILALWLCASLAQAAEPEVKIGAAVDELHFKDIRYLSRSLSTSAQESVRPGLRGERLSHRGAVSAGFAAFKSAYRDKGVQFVAVNSGPGDTIVTMAAQAVEYGVEFPFVKDADCPRRRCARGGAQRRRLSFSTANARSGIADGSTINIVPAATAPSRHAAICRRLSRRSLRVRRLPCPAPPWMAASSPGRS